MSDERDSELRELTKQVQEAAGIESGPNRDGIWGLGSAKAVLSQFAKLGLTPTKPEPAPAGTILRGDGTWPYTARIDGEDIVCENIVITCFGGWGGGNNADPQDNGNTASGRNTKHEEIEGVSIAMDSRQFPGMEKRDPAGYGALRGAPFPKIPWGTLIDVTINGQTHRPKDGVVDLGPGHHASRPGEPHALDLTPWAAKLFSPHMELRSLARAFSARGNFRIIGGAKYVYQA